jgi:hypothetical protein
MLRFGMPGNGGQVKVNRARLAWGPAQVPGWLNQLGRSCQPGTIQVSTCYHTVTAPGSAPRKDVKATPHSTGEACLEDPVTVRQTDGFGAESQGAEAREALKFEPNREALWPNSEALFPAES